MAAASESCSTATLNLTPTQEMKGEVSYSCIGSTFNYWGSWWITSPCEEDRCKDRAAEARGVQHHRHHFRPQRSRQGCLDDDAGLLSMGYGQLRAASLSPGRTGKKA